MNALKPDKALQVYRLLAYGHGVREIARLAKVNRGTVARYRQKWQAVKPKLQEAYDLLNDGLCEEYDALINTLPDQPALAMADAWLNDVDERYNGPKSKFWPWD